MHYEPWNEDEKANGRKVKAKVDVAGGLIKAGQKVLAYHKFRVYVEDPNDSTRAARFDIDMSLFDDWFEELEPKKVPGYHEPPPAPKPEAKKPEAKKPEEKKPAKKDAAKPAAAAKPEKGK